MKLINDKELFEFLYDETTEDPKPKFFLKKLTGGEVQHIQDIVSTVDDKNIIHYHGGASNKLMIQYSLVKWEGITGSDNVAVECNNLNKEKLPSEVMKWLIGKITELNKLSGIPKDEIKNS